MFLSSHSTLGKIPIVVIKNNIKVKPENDIDLPLHGLNFITLLFNISSLIPNSLDKFFILISFSEAKTGRQTINDARHIKRILKCFILISVDKS